MGFFRPFGKGGMSIFKNLYDLKKEKKYFILFWYRPLSSMSSMSIFIPILQSHPALYDISLQEFPVVVLAVLAAHHHHLPPPHHLESFV